MDANRPRRALLFGLPGALKRAGSALRRNGSARGIDVEDRIRKVEAELEEARRLDGSAPPRASP